MPGASFGSVAAHFDRFLSFPFAGQLPVVGSVNPPRMHRPFELQFLLLLLFMPFLCDAFTVIHRRCRTSFLLPAIVRHPTAAARVRIRQLDPQANHLSSFYFSSSSSFFFLSSLRSASICSSSTTTIANSVPLPHLSLVLDINKTILLEDPAGGKDVQALLNEIVSEIAYGRVDQLKPQHKQQQSRKWSADLSMSLHVGPRPPGTPPSLVSYASFVHDTYPDLPAINLKQMKAIRDGLKGTFTLPGQPGHRFASEITMLTEALRLPPGLSPGLMKAAGLEGQKRVGILPAFFHFLLRLQAEQETQQQQEEEGGRGSDTFSTSFSKSPSSISPASQQKKEASSWRFAVQFRTFGEDLPRVIQEFNLFVRGNHPLFPGQRLV